MYIYTEATGRSSYNASLISPELHGVGCLQFYFHMYGDNMGTLRVKVAGRVTWELFGNQGNMWKRATLPLQNLTTDGYRVPMQQTVVIY